MKIVNGKKFIYPICFAGIMLIDWSRGGARWNYWATMINLSGVIMAIVMAVFFTWKNQPWKKYVVWYSIWLLGSVIGYAVWKNDPGEVFLSQYITAALGILALGVIALRIWLDRKQLPNAYMGNALLIAVWVIMSVLMVLSPYGEIWQLYYLLMFGMFYLIPLTKAQKEELWIGVADGCILGFFIIQIWAYGFRPYDEFRYAGAYSNCNMNALFYLVTYIMVLFRLHYKGQKRWMNSFLVVLAAGLGNFILFTMTRTAILVLIIVTFFYAFYEYRIFRKVSFVKICMRFCVFAVCILLTFPCVYGTIRYLPVILHHPVWWDGEYAESKVHSYDPYDSDKYISFERAIEQMLLRCLGVNIDIEFAEDNVEEIAFGGAVTPKVLAIIPQVGSGVNVQMSVTGEVNDELLSDGDAWRSSKVRLAIYKKYLKNLNLMGHEMEEGYFQITNDYHAWHAQNVFIQVLFYYGIPAGICFIFLTLAVGWKALYVAFKEKKAESLLVVLVGMVFVGYGMLECVWYMGQSILFLMYLVPKILIDNRE